MSIQFEIKAVHSLPHVRAGGEAVQEQHEFVARAAPRDAVTGTKFIQQRGCGADVNIAPGVTKVVVKGFQIIEIEHGQRADAG